MGLGGQFPMLMDEYRLQKLLRSKVDGARVVFIVDQGFWALIPHSYNRDFYPTGGTVAVQFLGETMGECRARMWDCWRVELPDE